MNNITTNNKQSFIEFISKSTPDELNKFIMENGKPPKNILMYRLVDKSKDNRVINKKLVEFMKSIK